MDDTITKLSNPNHIIPTLQTLQLTKEEMFDIATKFIQSEKTILNAMIILNQLESNQQIYQLVNDEKLLIYLQHQDNKVQENTLILLNQLSLTFNFEHLANEIQNILLNALIWDLSYKTYNSVFKLLQELMKCPFPDIKNQIKIIEPMFNNKYYFTNKKDQFIQGILGAFEIFLKKGYLLKNVISIIEIIQRSSRHQNKYVRIYGLKFIQSLIPFKEKKQWKNIINATIQFGLQDESLEVRVQALNAYSLLQPQNKDQFLIALLNNCHTENLMEKSAQISNQQFPSPNGPPILGLITIIRDKLLKESLLYNYYCSTSRYYQIRCSGLQTLQTTVLFMKNIPNALPYKEILKIAQNCSLFETDPIVRQSAFSLMYHLIRLYQNECSEYQSQIIENCTFHLSDVPFECKELCAKILALINFKLIELFDQKLQLIKDKEIAYLDYIGIVPPTEEAQQQLQKSIEVQGGKEKVIARHQSHSLYGIALCFRYSAQQSPDEQLLGQLLCKLSQALKYVEIQRHQVLETIIEGLQELKIVKRLPIKLLDQTDILQFMQQYKEIDLLQKIGEIVGQTILKGRL